MTILRYQQGRSFRKTLSGSVEKLPALIAFDGDATLLKSTSRRPVATAAALLQEVFNSGGFLRLNRAMNGSVTT
jgi:hypothetical protein